MRLATGWRGPAGPPGFYWSSPQTLAPVASVGDPSFRAARPPTPSPFDRNRRCSGRRFAWDDGDSHPPRPGSGQFDFGGSPDRIGAGIGAFCCRRRHRTGPRQREANTTYRCGPAGGKWGVWARVPLLAGLGMILGELDSGVAVILVNYALLFLLAALGLGWSARRLVWVAAIWVVAVPVASHFLRMQLPPTSFVQPSFTALADSGALVHELLVTGYYPVIPWLGYLWAGMAVGRLDLSSKRVAMNLAGLGALIGVAGAWLSPIVVGDRLGELPTQFFGVTPTDSLLYLAVVTPASWATPIDLAHTIGSALRCGWAFAARRSLPWLDRCRGGDDSQSVHRSCSRSRLQSRNR